MTRPDPSAFRYHWLYSATAALLCTGLMRTGQSAALSEPSNVPPVLTPWGTYNPAALRFTTRAYSAEAARLILQEANLVARELQLPERLPIREGDLSEVHVTPYGRSRVRTKPIGSVTTKNYCYYASIDHKLSFIEGTHEDEDCLRWRRDYRWPISQLNTNAAYKLAVEWLSKARMDVKGLSRDCRVEVTLDPEANATGRARRTFVPAFFVSWMYLTPPPMQRDAASVRLFLPTKTLMYLRVEDAKYILREPVIFTNLTELLQQ